MTATAEALPNPDAFDPQRVIYRAFDNARAYLDDLYNVYRSLYDLPEIRYEEELSDKSLFDYCRKRDYYNLIVPYTLDGKLLVERAFAHNRLSWGVIGGGVKPALNDNFVNAVQRHIERYVQDMRLGEIEPIAFLDNIFRHDGEEHHHRGIAFIARIRNPRPQRLLDDAYNSRSFFVPGEIDPMIFGSRHHQDVVRHAKPRIALATLFGEQENEIEVNDRYRHRYQVHAAIVKPLMSLASRIFYESSIDDLNRRIESILTSNNNKSVMDVACGENLSHIRLAAENKVSLVVGNDISWSQIELMRDAVSTKKFRNLDSFVLFTNHDARRLPFADDAFGCVICKNVLHHMPDQDSVQALISETRRVGRRALIVEVLDPKYEGRWGRLRHRYYLDFLHDAGTHFLSRQEFHHLTDFPDRRELFEMRTVRGIYQFALFHNDESIQE